MDPAATRPAVRHTAHSSGPVTVRVHQGRLPDRSMDCPVGPSRPQRGVVTPVATPTAAHMTVRCAAALPRHAAQLMLPREVSPWTTVAALADDLIPVACRSPWSTHAARTPDTATSGACGRRRSAASRTTTPPSGPALPGTPSGTARTWSGWASPTAIDGLVNVAEPQSRVPQNRLSASALRCGSCTIHQCPSPSTSSMRAPRPR